jgi:tripartite-type tricarboxylate transporter receptor subunit TctC
LGSAASALAAAYGPVWAQAKPVRIVVPFAAGSYTDNVLRIALPGLSEKLGASIVVDNRPGANGIIAADAVAKSAPDGLTFLMGGASANAANPSLYKTLPYDPVKDLVPVVRFGLLPFVLLVNPSVPAKSVPELIDHAKKNPGKLAYATPNSATLVGMETFKRSAGVDILQVPYKSSPQAMLDLVAGQVQVLIADFATAMPHVRSGKARVIAATMARRTPLMPDVPVIAEVLKGYDISAWNGLFAPAGTPREAMSKVAEAAMAALAQRDVQDKLSGIGFEISPMGPESFGPYVREQIGVWAQIIRDSGIKPE